MQLSAMILQSVPAQRTTSFEAAADGESGESLRPFGIVFAALWLGMLVFLFFARRRQEALRARVERIEQLVNDAAR